MKLGVMQNQSMQLNYFITRFYLFIIFTLLNSYLFAMEVGLTTDERKPIFQLHILRDNSFDMLGNTTYEQSIQIFKKINLSLKSDFVITEQDIEKYDWKQQSIELTTDKSMNLIRKYLAKNISSDDFVSKKYSWSDIEHALHALAFLVVLNNEVMYGGIFIHRISSIGSSHPVIYVQPGSKISLNPLQFQVKLIIRPLPSFFSVGYYQSMETELKQRIEHEKIYSFFSKIKKLVN